MDGNRVNARYFSLREARSLLPQVKDLMVEVQSARHEILRLRPEVWPALSHAAGNGGTEAAGEMLAHFLRLEAGVKGILHMGILVKDIDQGIVHFLARRHGREVYLCWQHGEDELRYWHELNDDFSQRQLIDGHDFEG
jgi:hypothetical protein